MTVTVETTNAGCHADVTPAALERLVQQAGDDNPYLIVTRDDRPGFAQAHIVPPKRDGRRRFRVEYREDDASPMRSTELVLERAVDVLLGWAFDRTGWTARIRWHTEKLEPYVNLRGQCEFAPGPDGARLCRLHGKSDERAPDAPELAPLWDIVGDGADDDAAYAEFFTRLYIFLSEEPLDVRIAWGWWLGQWIVKLPREQIPAVRLHLDADQQDRLQKVTKRVWPESATAEG